MHWSSSNCLSPPISTSLIVGFQLRKNLPGADPYTSGEQRWRRSSYRADLARSTGLTIFVAIHIMPRYMSEHSSIFQRAPPIVSLFAGRLPTMRPSQGHRSHTLATDLVPTGGLSRSGGECAILVLLLGQGGRWTIHTIYLAFTGRASHRA